MNNSVKIIKVTNKFVNKEFKFDNRAWVSIDPYNWEYKSDEDDVKTYIHGNLWFKENHRVAYEGCSELPKEVVMALKHIGYDLQ
nr:MAG TPA: hypothetical protein [Caudoviricetes sp.]